MCTKRSIFLSRAERSVREREKERNQRLVEREREGEREREIHIYIYIYESAVSPSRVIIRKYTDKGWRYFLVVRGETG